MKRLFVPVLAFFFSAWLVGCSGETHEGLVQDLINMMGQASTEVGNIKDKVRVAIDAAKKGNALDLKEAMDATTKLKETGAKAQAIKASIEQIKSRITDAERQANLEAKRKDLTNAFKRLLDTREELRTALKEAESFPNAKEKVDALRVKITEAESPFEALSR